MFIANHGSFFDMYYACQYLYPKRGAIIGNRFYLRGKLASRITKQIGVIPKKLFVADLETIKMTIKSAKEGNSIILFPEGRLSVELPKRSPGISFEVVHTDVTIAVEEDEEPWDILDEEVNDEDLDEIDNIDEDFKNAIKNNINCIFFR